MIRRDIIAEQGHRVEVRRREPHRGGVVVGVERAIAHVVGDKVSVLGPIERGVLGVATDNETFGAEVVKGRLSQHTIGEGDTELGNITNALLDDADHPRDTSE